MPPTYDDLRAEGETLRQRVGELSPAPIATALLVDAIRRWQLTCERTIALRSPHVVTAFRAQSGPFQRLMGDGWMPKPGWRQELDDAIDRWMNALDGVISP